MEGKNIITVKSLNKSKFNGISRHAKTVFTLTTELSDSGYRTGLTPAEETEFENALGLLKGTLSKKSKWWGDLEIKIPAKQLKMNLADPLNELRYKVMLASSKVANSQLELTKWPNALFVIVDEQKEAEAEAVIIDMELEALDKFMNLSLEERKGVLKLYGERKVDDASESLIKSTLHKKIKNNAKEFLDIVNDKSMRAKIFIHDLLEYGILTKVKNYYKDGDEVIGNSIEEAMNYVDSPKHASIKAALTDKLLKAKKKATATI